MAKLYGMGNNILSEMITRLMINEDFYKFVYYKDVKDKDILSQPELDDPVTELYNKQVWLYRRPQKILHNQDVNVFLTLDDMRNENAKSEKIKTMTINIGVIVHESCIMTANGSRDVALLEIITNIIEEDKYFKSLGKCTIYRVNRLYGLNLEYSGYEIICKIDGVKEKK